jgi:glycerol uptake facilitator protein
VPIAGPLLGGVIGAGMYQYLVKPYLPPRTSVAA